MPCSAEAHYVIEGVGGFPGGFLHPLLAPAHSLLLVGLGLLIGQQSARDRRILILLFVLAALGAIVAVAFAATADNADLAVLLAATLAGLLAAAGYRLPVVVPALIAAPAAAALILDSVPAVISPSETLLALAGSLIAAGAALFLVTAVTAEPQHQWQRIGVRILAAWIATVAILVLALRFTR
jgi:hypothetical protein